MILFFDIIHLFNGNFVKSLKTLFRYLKNVQFSSNFGQKSHHKMISSCKKNKEAIHLECPAYQWKGVIENRISIVISKEFELLSPDGRGGALTIQIFARRLKWMAPTSKNFQDGPLSLPAAERKEVSHIDFSQLQFFFDFCTIMLSWKGTYFYYVAQG